jgi:hypothetical protein
MSLRSSQSFPGASVEGQTVTNWRLIWITTALEVVFVAGLFVTWRLLPHAKPRPEARAAAQSPTLARVRPVTAPVGTIASVTEVKQTKLESPVEQKSTSAKSIQPPAAALSRPPAKPAAQPAKLARSLPKAESPRQLTAAAKAKQVVSAARPQPTLKTKTEATPAVEFPAPPVFKRINTLTDTHLTELILSRVPEIEIDKVKGTSSQLLAETKGGAGAPKIRTVLDLLSERADLGGLPMRNGADCQIPREQAEDLQVISRGMRPLVTELRAELQRGLSHRMLGYSLQTLAREGRGRGRSGKSSFNENEASLSTGSRLSLKPTAVSGVVQILQAEEVPLRALLIQLLAATPDRAATTALAQRAVFDTSDFLREDAVEELRNRPEEEYRQVLLDGLRYPWAPAADHAAEALVALQDRKALRELVNLLELPDPAAPRQGLDRKWFEPQLVRVNHLRNCLLCHSPSFDKEDLVRGPVPTPGQKLPEVYYSEFRNPAIRADVTYLRQDFSVLQKVPDPGKWPERQRFDYVIRQRELTPGELRAYQAADESAAKKGSLRTYPQREAVLFALRELAGKDAGVSALAWRKLIARMTDTLGRKPKT